AVLIVVATGSYVGWQNYQQNQSRTQGAEFNAAAALMTAGNPSAAAAAFGELAEDGNAGYRPLARLREAAAFLAAGEGVKALAVYDQLAFDGSVDPEFTALADLMAGYYLLDNGTTEEVRSRISRLTEPGSLFNASANELLALSHIKDGEITKAREVLNIIQNDATVPDDIKGRVTQLLAALEGK
ncbi:MAG: tetratricopeptide repeat protein, partial [Sneathiella sp.]